MSSVMMLSSLQSEPKSASLPKVDEIISTLEFVGLKYLSRRFLIASPSYRDRTEFPSSKRSAGRYEQVEASATSSTSSSGLGSS